VSEQASRPDIVQTGHGLVDRGQSPVGVRLIVLYKLVKAALQATGAIVLLILILAGITDHVHELVTQLRQHTASGWSIALAGLLVTATTRHGVYLAMAALAADAVVSLFEGWALHRRMWWAPWLIVVATGSLLPIEVYEIARHPHLGRVLIFVINLVIVVYLAHRVVRERRAHSGDAIATPVAIPGAEP
jgi:uncharacterized membrane protein (DUF2068 family)